MTKYRIHISENANSDLIDIYDYIRLILKNKEAAINTIKGLNNTLKKIEFLPERFKFYSKTDLRYTKYKKYYIFFEIDKTKTVINIIRIIHSSRNVLKIINEQN